MTCPFPHTRRDQTWLLVGLGLGAALTYKLSKPKRGPVRHVVLLQVKEDTPRDLLESFVAQAKELPAKIPEISTYEVATEITGLGVEKRLSQQRWLQS